MGSRDDDDDDDDDDDKEEEDRPLPVAVETDEGALEFAGEDGSKLRFKQGAISLDQVSLDATSADQPQSQSGRSLLTRISVYFSTLPGEAAGDVKCLQRRPGMMIRVPKLLSNTMSPCLLLLLALIDLPYLALWIEHSERPMAGVRTRQYSGRVHITRAMTPYRQTTFTLYRPSLVLPSFLPTGVCMVSPSHHGHWRVPSRPGARLFRTVRKPPRLLVELLAHRLSLLCNNKGVSPPPRPPLDSGP